jgi:hypothetical protein
MPTRHASCSCGQLRVTTEGEPVRISICHCHACQQRTGSVFGYQARWPRDQVEISGESREWVRHADDDGEERRFQFCPACGSTVYYLNAASPDLVAVAVGNFADGSFPPPTVSVWEDRRHPWVGLPSTITHHD